jgi:hypothetical protein
MTWRHYNKIGHWIQRAYSKASGNDTIDPYPLFPGEARKILIIKKNIFEELRRLYKTFCRSLEPQTAKRPLPASRHAKRHVEECRPPVSEHVRPYEPSNAIAINECNYRRWCRVNEWFAEFGPDAEKFKRAVFIQ